MLETYESNWMSTVVANIDSIEETLSLKIGRKQAVAFSSGTSAHHLAVKIAGEKLFGKGNLRGREVACSDMIVAATVNLVIYEGMVPVFKVTL